VSEELIERARAWVAADPDPVTRAELNELIDGRALAEIGERFQAELDFGTAGLRGEVGAGPARMNRAVVMRAVRALAEHLLEAGTQMRSRPVVVGYDARPSSRSFAEASAGVLLAAGISVRWFDEPVPTPLVCFAARVYAAAAAVVVTASHNPSPDNGLKIYGSDARQLVAPEDVDVARRRDAVGPAAAIPCVDFARVDERLERVPAALVAQYFDEVEALLPPRAPAPKLRVVYTPVHGVGLELARAGLERRGFRDVHVVAEQAAPDGRFPTAPFPNPELPGVLDRALDLARRVSADIVVANDPDADRLAAAACDPSGGWQVLSGNEIAVLLANFVLTRAPSTPRPLLVTSVVSTPLLTEIARTHGAHCERTLTGFKWIWHAARTLEARGEVAYAMGCEEALGYSIGGVVRDKDGISALLWLCELAQQLRARGETLFDELHRIYARCGVWRSAQASLFNPGASGIERTRAQVERLTRSRPSAISGLRVDRVIDYREGAERRPVWLGATALIELVLEDQSRVLVRPSDTEPKLKIYADARTVPAASESIAGASERAYRTARSLSEELARWLEAGA
jgi:phosphomannomutase